MGLDSDSAGFECNPIQHPQRDRRNERPQFFKQCVCALCVANITLITANVLRFLEFPLNYSEHFFCEMIDGDSSVRIEAQMQLQESLPQDGQYFIRRSH